MNDNAPATTGKEIVNRDPVAALLETNRESLQQALPKHVTVDRFLRVALTTIKRTPKLIDADRRSLIASLMTAAQLGLEPDGILGHAYLVPFNVKNKKTQQWETQVQLIVGYKGYIQLARNSGEVKSIQAKPVYEGDIFSFEYGFEEKPTHIPQGDRKPDAKLTHVWLVVNFTNGGRHWDVMDRPAIERVMKMSQGYQNAEKSYQDKPPRRDSPWHLHFDPMAVKSIIRANAKFMPLQVQRAAALDDHIELGNVVQLEPGTGEVMIEGTADTVDHDGQPDTSGDEPPAQEEKKAEEKKEAPAKTEAKPVEPEKRRPGRPAKKAKPAAEEKKPAPEQPVTPDPEPWKVRATDTEVSYDKRVRAAIAAAPTAAAFDAINEGIDWTWLGGKSDEVHDALIDYCQEREDAFRAEPTPSAQEQETAPVTTTAAAPAANDALPPAIKWFTPAASWADKFIEIAKTCKTRAQFEAWIKIKDNADGVLYCARFSPPSHDRVNAVVTNLRATLPKG